MLKFNYLIYFTLVLIAISISLLGSREVVGAVGETHKQLRRSFSTTAYVWGMLIMQVSNSNYFILILPLQREVVSNLALRFCMFPPPGAQSGLHSGCEKQPVHFLPLISEWMFWKYKCCPSVKIFLLLLSCPIDYDGRIWFIIKSRKKNHMCNNRQSWQLKAMYSSHFFRENDSNFRKLILTYLIRFFCP